MRRLNQQNWVRKDADRKPHIPAKAVDEDKEPDEVPEEEQDNQKENES
jgi:hypothetical protein